MPTPFNRGEIRRRKLANIIVRGTFTNGGGAVTQFFSLDPGLPTSIIMSHNSGDAPTIEITNTLNAADDLEDATALFGEIYDGASTPFIAGDSKGLTGVKVISNSPTNANVEFSIIQYSRGRN